MSIDVRVESRDLEALSRRLAALGNGLGLAFAQARATNALAFNVRTRWRDKAGEVFDRPTPFTRNAALVRKATVQQPVATVFIRDEAGDGVPPARYLQQQVTGGERRLKRSEKALQAAGLMPEGHVAVPGQGAKLDSYGNIRAGQITRILSALKASNDPLQNATARSQAKAKRRNAPAIFALPSPRGRLPPGVYERRGRKIIPLLVFVRGARYRPRFDVFQYAREVIQRDGVAVLRKELVAEIEREIARAGRANDRP